MSIWPEERPIHPTPVPLPPPPVEEMVIAPFDDDAIVTLDPATRYEVPSVSLVNDPLRPELKLTAPVNVDPEIVATTESSMESVALPAGPPSVRLSPVPPVKMRSALSEPVADMTTYVASASPGPDPPPPREALSILPVYINAFANAGI